MIKNFIDRPVLSTVISIFIVILGVLGILNLPMTQYPDIAPATISIKTTYTGADAATVLESVIIPIEEQVNGVEGMKYITSKASNNGSAEITVVFNEGIDPDIATVNVQNRVARATPVLPQEVTRFGVVTQKQQTSALMFLTFYSENENYDDVFIQNYLNINVIPAIKRITGVGDASAFGAKDYAMRIWIDPQKLNSYGITPNEVVNAINQQSRQATPGKIGENIGQSFEYVIKYSGKYNEVKQYENIIVKTGKNKELLRLKDIAQIELDAFVYSSLGETNGKPSVSIGIYQTPGSNAQEIINEIKSALEDVKKSFPEGLDYEINYDTNDFLTASINKVVMTLLEALILVFIVVFIFLQDFRSTLIPAIAVPVSIIGTFFFLNMFGFSINLLTLSALVLAIGIVVDDAIVVVEAVHAKMESSSKEETKNMNEVTKKAMDGISGAIISITLVMASVFIPVTFIQGPSGVFYKQFGITLMVAIAISAVNALTLSPMLSALLLKPHKEDEGNKKGLLQSFYAKFNKQFDALTEKYGNLVSFVIARKWIAFLIVIVAFIGIYFSGKSMSSGFVPNEDRKIILANVELPPSSSLDRTFEIMRQLSKKARNIKGIKTVSVIGGSSIISGAGSNYGIAFIKLEDFDERKDKSQSVENIIKQLFQVSGSMPDARMLFFNLPSVPGYGMSSGFELKLLDKSGGEFTKLDKTTKGYLQALMQRPEVQYAITSFNTSYPQYDLEINVPVAYQNGVTSSEIFSALSGYIGGIYAADFTKYGKKFRVMVQASPENRKDLNSIDNIYVKNNKGEMSPVSQYISLKRVYGPQFVERFNLFNTASITGAPSPGYSTGDAIKAVQEVAKTNLPADYEVDYSGITREEIKSGNQTTFIYLIVVLFVFLLLSAQYESYLVPFSVLLSIPVGMFGAFISQQIAGLENNIYFQIALVMLIGLLAKNAILIVEFALQERAKGNSIAKAAVLGAEERLRPILMTSFAFILGLMPLVLSSGVGAVGNRSLATGAAFGMLVGTALGLIVIPVFFVIFQTLQEKLKPVKIKNQ